MDLHHSIRMLLENEAIELLKDLCFSLGDLGVSGKTHPSALPLFMTSMRMSHFAKKPSPTAEESDGMVLTAFTKLAYQLKATCQEYPNRDQDCFGMCGPSCTCWRIICGDCCLHQGCAEHDKCCRTDYWSLNCLIPIPFSCNSYGQRCGAA